MIGEDSMDFPPNSGLVFLVCSTFIGSMNTFSGCHSLYINDRSNKTSAAFTYEHVWNVVKEHGKYNSATHIHSFQPPKRTKISSSGAYTSSASDANFGENPEIAISLEDIDKEDFKVQLQQVTRTRPIGRDKAKAEAKGKAKLKGKVGIEPSEYDLRKLKLIDEISSTNRAKSEAIEKFEHRIDKFYEIEKKKLEMKQKKLRCKSGKYSSLTPLT
ncbi:hypothetical protein E3N88_01846 [Mikania micrantha]|uniref:No apical meristem-associated C-terminal domain-containing protein n=1 Tax=Mikania micrantha TaxID=192012 RepID=A0A5N6Q4U8_9ASTR|nr:hypothetical protein E3N88_01846 [Mikania micrantha]